ncbi:hypothetical protein CesoFtcFv8_013077 [Champsocephalus esox]|uniref:FXYD domain-containing ion transport regulator n=1 Tax=Champsocephalus esox TaxID=159716 RepID=A0AAN8BWT1_9TELE|nr:hypothetical protein CesoFtcFv8_013077 [Champsocephalus esox]
MWLHWCWRAVWRKVAVSDSHIRLLERKFLVLSAAKLNSWEVKKMAKICALVLMTLVSLGFAEEQKMEEDPFNFDYHQLRVGGLILAAVLCLIGITILFSGHCRCKFNQDKRARTGSNAQQMLSDQGRSCEC